MLPVLMGLNVIARASGSSFNLQKAPKRWEEQEEGKQHRQNYGMGCDMRERGRERGRRGKGRIMSQWLSPRYGAVSLLL